MKRLRPVNILIRGLLLLFAASAVTGCLKESLTECPVEHSLTVRAYDADGRDMTHSGELSDVSLYIFDSEGCFLERIETGMGTDVELRIPMGEHIKIVGWGNASGSGDIFPEFTPGEDHIGDCLMGLEAVTRSGYTAYCSPADMFRGMITIYSGESDREHLLPVRRQTGSMSVTVRKLREFTGCGDDDFSIVVRETRTHIGFEGGLMGERTAAYCPSGTFDTAGEYSTGIFRMLPDSEGVSIDVYHGAELLRTVNICSGDPITVTAGVTTNVLIDFATLFDVRLSVTGWDIMEIWRDF